MGDMEAVRGSMQNPRIGGHELFAFFTCDVNSVVRPVHPKAMPVCGTEPEESNYGWPPIGRFPKMLQRQYRAERMTLVPDEISSEPLLSWTAGKPRNKAARDALFRGRAFLRHQVPQPV